jgi:Transcriptional antiterminator
MVILKIFNNNSIAALSENKQDIIITGAGIGFGKKVGDIVDEGKIERKYVLQDEYKKRFEQSLESIPTVYFEITHQIVKRATVILQTDFSSEVFLAITDCISFAIKRKKEASYLPNIILNETKVLYKKEYEIGLLALEYIREKTGVQLGEDEAGYIALHLATFTLSNQKRNVIKIVAFTKEVIEIIQKTMNCNISEDTLAYARISTHLKYLGEHIFRNESVSIEDTTYDIREILKENEKLALCMRRIVKLIERRYDYTLSPDEQTYLCIHIKRNII